MNDTPTPRTDAEAWNPNINTGFVVRANFARTLEREIADKDEEIERLKSVIQEYQTTSAGLLNYTCAERDAARSERDAARASFATIKETRDALIEQSERERMEIARLKRAVGQTEDARAGWEKTFNALQQTQRALSGNKDYGEVMAERDAALAERDKFERQWREDFEVRTHLLSERDAALADVEAYRTAGNEIEASMAEKLKVVREQRDAALAACEQMRESLGVAHAHADYGSKKQSDFVTASLALTPANDLRGYVKREVLERCLELLERAASRELWSEYPSYQNALTTARAELERTKCTI